MNKYLITGMGDSKELLSYLVYFFPISYGDVNSSEE